MLVAINAINHAPVIHNTVMGEPISPNIKITATNEKYEIACDFIIKKSSFVIPTPPRHAFAPPLPMQIIMSSIVAVSRTQCLYWAATFAVIRPSNPIAVLRNPKIFSSRSAVRSQGFPLMRR